MIASCTVRCLLLPFVLGVSAVALVGCGGGGTSGQKKPEMVITQPTDRTQTPPPEQDIYKYADPVYQCVGFRRGDAFQSWWAVYNKCNIPISVAYCILGGRYPDEAPYRLFECGAGFLGFYYSGSVGRGVPELELQPGDYSVMSGYEIDFGGRISFFACPTGYSVVEVKERDSRAWCRMLNR